MKKKLSYFIASMCGVGFFPFASGTVASIVSIPVAFLIAYFFDFYGLFFASFLIYILGVIATKEVLKYTKHDPSLVVIDETVGQVLTFLFVSPYLYQTLSCKVIILYVCGFILFRLFDITKPCLVGWADEKIENAHGVMLDDVFAGLFAGIILLAVALVI